MSVRTGPYTEDEISEIRKATGKVREGAQIRDLAQDLAQQLNRSSRGLALTIGRELARSNPRRPRQRRIRALGRGRDMTALTQRLSLLARELDELGRRRRDLDRQIEGRLQEYSDLKSKLIQAITPANVDVTMQQQIEAATVGAEE
ncbi:MAG: hypothetical protein M0Z66_02655 [Thermaerobacter sp.]|nr:hypothetical protein [Thermaerobacter sp.]